VSRFHRRSISLPIVLSVLSVGLTIALLVGWTLVIVRNIELTRELTGNTLLMVGGIVSFVAIMTVLVLLTVFVVREIREVRRRDSFIDSMTHELKSPLASLRLGLETQARSEVPGEQREQLREMMLEDVQRLSGLIDGILDANRLEHGRVVKGLEEVDVGALARESVDTLRRRHRLPADAIAVEVPDPLRIVSDGPALRTIVENLIDNAVKYSDPPARIHVRARSDRYSHFVLEVEDRGIGIPRRELRRVFQRFYRAPSESTRQRHGTGLGLFVVQALVRSLGGRVEARSPGPGEGTTMSVRLPLRPRGV
jgi:signal transduction histidine kinase